MPRKLNGPGPAKARALVIGARRTLELWQSTDYRLRELFEAADVMSEGATRSEPDGATYYGSTSVLLPQVRSGAPIGRVRAELFVRRDARGIRVDVDVEARVFKNSERPQRAPRNVAGAVPKRPSRAS